MARVETRDNGYWYGQSAEQRAVAVLEAMRSYRSAEAAMRRRTRDSMHMGENDLLALRYIIANAQRGKSVGPKEIAEYLGVKSASVTALIDRLEKSGHVKREPSPFDRRSLIIVSTAATESEIRATLSEMHERMIAVALELDPDLALGITRFLDSMRDAVDQIDRHDA